MKSKIIRGYTVQYNDDAKKGVEHLAYTLSYAESDSLFRNARISGKIKFEDRVGKNYTLVRKTGSTFVLKKRSAWL
ncbi:hypothetical protein MYX07_02605 [Patescibacteria group bacterium AH-259-L07]|nr:hypothetical protein [Patescibacteria group bacterium AH-259-L07]